jgi:hypothetical protein
MYEYDFVRYLFLDTRKQEILKALPPHSGSDLVHILAGRDQSLHLP